MKGIILAGGNGRRMQPLTEITNKHLLPVYDKPMIFYPINTLKQGGITDIMIVTGKEYAGGFLKLLGSGREFGCRFHFEIQEDALGIAHALDLAESFVGNENCAVILGDNVYEDNFSESIRSFKSGAHIFLKYVQDAYRFGVAEVNDQKITSITEKPEGAQDGLAVTGLYLYDQSVFSKIKTLKPSNRGELEITDVNNAYVTEGNMDFTILDGEWTDCGTFESLYHANTIARKILQAGQPTPFEKEIQDRRQRQLDSDRKWKQNIIATHK